MQWLFPPNMVKEQQSVAEDDGQNGYPYVISQFQADELFGERGSTHQPNVLVFWF
jgi:hypothetical protein